MTLWKRQNHTDKSREVEYKEVLGNFYYYEMVLYIYSSSVHITVCLCQHLHNYTQKRIDFAYNTLHKVQKEVKQQTFQKKAQNIFVLSEQVVFLNNTQKAQEISTNFKNTKNFYLLQRHC